MLGRQNSEGIFLQPIDQLYESKNYKNYSEDAYQGKFFDDFHSNMVDYLNLSTDSDSELSRQNSTPVNERVMPDTKISSLLTNGWKNNVDMFRNYQLSLLKNIAGYRNSLNVNQNQTNPFNNTQRNRTYSSPTVNAMNNFPQAEVSPFNPFLRKSSSDVIQVNPDMRVVKNKFSCFKESC